MLNRVVLMGRLVANPEYRQTVNGTAVTTFRMAVDRDYVKQGEERQTDFFTIVAWRQTADFVNKFFQKGSLAVVEGVLQNRSYQDKTGADRTITEIVSEHIYFGETIKREPQKIAEPAAEFELVEEDGDLPF